MIHRSPYPPLDIPATPLADFVLDRAAARGDRAALVDSITGRTHRYGDLPEIVNRTAAGLARLGLRKGDACAIFSANTIDYPVAILALARLGAVATTASPLYTKDDLARQLVDSKARILITSSSLAGTWNAALEGSNVEHVVTFDGAAGGAIGFDELKAAPGSPPQVAIDPEDPVALPYSSGTTGLPKGVMLTHRNLVANILQTDGSDHYLHDRDTTVAFLPFFHIYGLEVIAMLGLWSGATLVVMPRFELEPYLDLVERHRATLLHVVPPVVVALAKHPSVARRDFSSIRKLFSGAAPLAADTIEQCTRRLGCVLQQGYGLTESSPATHVTCADPARVKYGSIGKTVPNTECRVVDPATRQDVVPGQDGEIWVRGPQVMKGYFNRPDETRATLDDEGWLHTGDVGHADADGDFFIVDRLKELIKYKGMQVPPAELEALLLSHPAVADAAVVPQKDEEAGEIPRAFVVLKTPATAEELMAYVAARVAPYKKIRRVDFIDAIPKSPSGKILRRLLRDVAVALALTASIAALGAAGQAPTIAPPASTLVERARANGVQFEKTVAATQRLLRAWLTHADPRTTLLPDRLDPDRSKWIYTPHNSGADLYPYLVLTAQLTDPDLYEGRMMEMLRNEIRYTSAKASVPGNLTFATGELGPPSLFGAGEYAKDGLVSVTEYLGRTPWFHRMVDLTADAMEQAPVATRFGKLPASDTELNGDYLQTLTRLVTMTRDQRFLEWARRIGDAYVEEVLPGNFGVPGMQWDFAAHTGDRRLRLRDHGNETVVGLTLLFALEHQLASDREVRYRTAVQRMLDRILQSAAPDGMLYNEVNAETLAPIDTRLSDNWGYVYGAVYTYYQVTGDTKYRDAVRRVLASLPKYRNYAWEPGRDLPLGSFDGYADSIESAIYLVNREPVPEALGWIESEMQVMLGMQRADGHIEDWYGEGNFNRTALLYAYMKTLGVRPLRWEPGVRVGAAMDGTRLVLSLAAPAPRPIQFDFARHRRVLNLQQNLVRLNEFPEWFTVDENTLYRIGRAGTAGEIRLGSELIAGITLDAGEWIVQPAAAR